MKQALPQSSLLVYYNWLKTTLLLTVSLFVAFWTYFCLVEMNSPTISKIYLAHELSFIVPDILWIVGLLLLSISWLKANSPKGIVAVICAGSALVFLGMIDVSFNFQQGIYATSIGDAILNGVINLLSLGYGLTLLFVGYKLLTEKFEFKR